MKIHAFVISWSGYSNNAAKIAHELGPIVDKLTVVYSNAEGNLEKGKGNWISVPDDWFYGKKHLKCLQEFEGEIFLQIQADAECLDWQRLIEFCRNAFERDKSLGVWAPLVIGSAHTAESIFQDNDLTSKSVALVDAIVWAMRSDIVNRMHPLPFQANKYGWGIDLAACVMAWSNGFKVTIESGIKVNHKYGSGYDRSEAQSLMRDFLAQLPEPQMELLNIFVSDADLRRGLEDGISVSSAISILKKSIKRSFRLRVAAVKKRFSTEKRSSMIT